MIVDDSMVARAVLSRMVDSDDGFEIAAVAGTAEDAIDALQAVQVDIILLDLEMPGAGGLRMLPGILKAAGGAKVLIVSSQAEEGAEATVAALALGAADTLPKPGTSRFNGRFSEVLLSKLRALADPDFVPATEVAAAARAPVAPVARFAPQGGKLDLNAPLRAMPADAVQVVAIGASTGGIHALGALFDKLPRRIGVPILITQHLPAAFMTVFARQLAVSSGREALVATDGMELLADRIIVAPGDAHMTIDVCRGAKVVRLVQGSVPSGCLPSVDPMLASIGAIYGPGALGVILTGMGRDGVEGAEKLVEAGGSIIAQNEASCAVWGMPRAVLEAGLVSAVMPPDKIARRIASRAREAPCR